MFNLPKTSWTNNPQYSKKAPLWNKIVIFNGKMNDFLLGEKLFLQTRILMVSLCRRFEIYFESPFHKNFSRHLQKKKRYFKKYRLLTFF